MHHMEKQRGQSRGLLSLLLDERPNIDSSNISSHKSVHVDAFSRPLWTSWAIPATDQGVQNLAALSCLCLCILYWRTRLLGCNATKDVICLIIYEESYLQNLARGAMQRGGGERESQYVNNTKSLSSFQNVTLLAFRQLGTPNPVCVENRNNWA